MISSGFDRSRVAVQIKEINLANALLTIEEIVSKVNGDPDSAMKVDSKLVQRVLRRMNALDVNDENSRFEINKRFPRGDDNTIFDPIGTPKGNQKMDEHIDAIVRALEDIEAEGSFSDRQGSGTSRKNIVNDEKLDNIENEIEDNTSDETKTKPTCESEEEAFLLTRTNTERPEDEAMGKSKENCTCQIF